MVSIASVTIKLWSYMYIDMKLKYSVVISIFNPDFYLNALLSFADQNCYSHVKFNVWSRMVCWYFYEFVLKTTAAEKPRNKQLLHSDFSLCLGFLLVFI